MVEPTDGTDAADRLEVAERSLAAIAELASGPVLQRLDDAERPLALIAGLASGPVTPAGTPESNLMDAEARLMQIHERGSRLPGKDGQVFLDARGRSHFSLISKTHSHQESSHLGD